MSPEAVRLLRKIEKLGPAGYRPGLRWRRYFSKLGLVVEERLGGRVRLTEKGRAAV